MKRRLQRLHLPYLRLILALALNILLAWQKVSQIGWLRPWLLPDRRALRVHMVGDRRYHLPVWIVLVHFLTTLITWRIAPPAGLALWFLPFAWAASVGTTAFLWILINRKKSYE